MARPKKYTTPEERVLAARSYRAKYYAMNRGPINKNRAEKRKVSLKDIKHAVTKPGPMGEPLFKNCTLLSRRPGRPVGAKNLEPVPMNSVVPDSEYDIEATFKTIIGPSSRERLAALCEHYVASGDYKQIYDMLSDIEELEKRMNRITTPIPHWQKEALDRPLSKAIRTVIKVLENLLLSAMEGDDVQGLLRKGLLLYQVAPDIVL